MGQWVALCYEVFILSTIIVKEFSLNTTTVLFIVPNYLLWCVNYILYIYSIFIIFSSSEVFKTYEETQKSKKKV